jgi:2-polyprenyl-3-methyl-5-hydroxy-6-metoxy-1,4-benzoquinol methylase
MSYVLEDNREFERLERQSKTTLYNPESELAGIDLSKARRILDAGSGSGIVSRFLANSLPLTEVVGVEQSDHRVQAAKKASASLKNLSFRAGSITSLPSDLGLFDAAVCRFVLEHMPKEAAVNALQEIRKHLRPAGTLVAIDIDGLFHNLYPRSSIVQDFLSRLDQVPSIDMQVGRKLPSWLLEAGFENVAWRIETMEICGSNLAIERQIIEERFAQNLPAMAALYGGSEEKARQFQTEFLKTLDGPGSVLFYNKFIVRGTKPGLKLL